MKRVPGKSTGAGRTSPRVSRAPLPSGRPPASDPALTIVTAHSRLHLQRIRDLFQEYAKELDVSLCFQDFEGELETLPGKYAPPHGCLLLAELNRSCAGCVALRLFRRGICEMKRLYVRPAFRRRQVGRALAVRVIQEAAHLGYHAMVLDTLSSLQPAVALYRSLGFKRTRAYYANPLPRVIYMKLNLRRSAAATNR